MSRFYDTLVAASRLQPNTSGRSEANREVPPADLRVTDVLETWNVGAVAAVAPVISEDPWAISRDRDAQPEQFVVHRDCFGIPARQMLETKALLLSTTDPPVREQYRRLRAKIIQLHSQKPFRTLVVTSPASNEGKSITVLNLALTFAMLPAFRVLVIDGDLRRSNLSSWLRVADRPGLRNVIEGSATINDAILQWDHVPISFVTSGNSDVPAAELLQSSRLSAAMRILAERFALVLVDSPPVNLLADAQLLANACDAVLLVARAFSTKRNSLEKAAQDLRDSRVIGTILNGGSGTGWYRYGRKY